MSLKQISGLGFLIGSIALAGCGRSPDAASTAQTSASGTIDGESDLSGWGLRAVDFNQLSPELRSFVEAFKGGHAAGRPMSDFPRAFEEMVESEPDDGYFWISTGLPMTQEFRQLASKHEEQGGTVYRPLLFLSVDQTTQRIVECSISVCGF